MAEWARPQTRRVVEPDNTASWRPTLQPVDGDVESESSITDSHKFDRLIGIAALIGGIICWGITPVMLRRLTPFVDGWTANGLRYPMAAVLYWPLLFFALKSGRLNRQLIRRCAFPAFFALGGQVFWALAHYELQASEIGFYVRLSTVWAIVCSMFLFLDERALLRKPGFYLGLTLITAGFLVMSSQGESDVSAQAVVTGGNFQLGLIYIILCAALFGFYMVSVRLCIPDVDPLLSFGVVCQLVSAGTIVGMLALGDLSSIAQQPALSWWLMIGSSLLGIGLGHIFMYAAVHRLGAAITSGCQTVMPFITAAIAAVVLAEGLNARQWTGGIVMVAGAIVLLSIEHVIHRHPPDEHSLADTHSSTN